MPESYGWEVGRGGMSGAVAGEALLASPLASPEGGVATGCPPPPLPSKAAACSPRVGLLGRDSH